MQDAQSCHIESLPVPLFQKAKHCVKAALGGIRHSCDSSSFGFQIVPLQIKLWWGETWEQGRKSTGFKPADYEFLTGAKQAAGDWKVLEIYWFPQDKKTHNGSKPLATPPY